MRRIIDEKGRLFGRVSIVDVLVVAVAVFVAISVYTKFRVHDNPLTTPDTVEATYTVTIPSIRLTSANLLRPGDSLFAQETGTFIGTISAVEIKEALGPEPLVDGTLVMGATENRYDATLTVVSQGSVSGGRFFADRSYELNINARVRMVTKYNDVSGFIDSIAIGRQNDS